MTNTDDFEKWLADTFAQGAICLTPYTVAKTAPSMFIMQSPSLAAFQNFLQSYAKAYNPIFLFKQNSGVNQYTYMTANSFFGMCITIDNGAAAPGVVVRMGLVENIQAWCASHTGTIAFFKAAIKFLLGYAVLNQAAILASISPEYLGAGTLLFGAIAWADNWVINNWSNAPGWHAKK